MWSGLEMGFGWSSLRRVPVETMPSTPLKKGDLSPGMKALETELAMPIVWDQGHTSIPLAVPVFPLRTGQTPRLEVTSTYALTKSGRYHPRPTERSSQEEENWLRVEKENRHDFLRERSPAPLVRAQARPVSSVGTAGPGVGAGDGPAPFDTWEGPWSSREYALWKKMSQGEKKKWNKRWREWSAAQSAVAFAQGVVEVDTSEGDPVVPDLPVPKESEGVPVPKESGKLPVAEESQGVPVPKDLEAVPKPKASETGPVPDESEAVPGSEKASSVRGDQSEKVPSEKGSRRHRRPRRRRSPSSYSSSPERRRRRRGDKAEPWLPPPPWFPWHLPLAQPHGAIPKVGPPLDQFRARGLPTPPPPPAS